MKNNCIIYETLNDVKSLSVDKKDGLMHLSGVFGVCGVRNNNKRVYETSNYSKMVKQLQERIKTEGCPGELEHPNSMNINLENISHRIDSINIDENGVVSGTITLLNTPKGKIAQAIVEGGLPLFISSRAQGNVSKDGIVTLEELKTYDLVGTPGFSQAKLHLNENQIAESINESCYIIKDINENNENEKNNDEEMVNEELVQQIEELKSQIEDLQEQLDRKPDLKQISEGIQNWVINEYSPKVEKWVKEEYDASIQESINDLENTINEKTDEKNTKRILEGIQNWIVNDYSAEVEKWIKEEYSKNIDQRNEKVLNGIEKWIKEEYSAEVEKWIVNEYSANVEKWIKEDFAQGIQNWIVNEYSAEVEKWVKEEYSDGVQNWVVEHLAPELDNWISNKIEESKVVTKEANLSSIDEILTMLENDANETKAKPKYNRVTVEAEENNEEPLFIKEMPASKRVEWNMASADVKESIYRRAKLYNFNNPNAIENFWENINFKEIKPVTESIYEGLDSIVDTREAAIRAAFRKNRA